MSEPGRSLEPIEPIENVLEAIDRSGQRALNRRRFLQLGAAIAAGTVVSSQLGPIRRLLDGSTADVGDAGKDGIVVMVYLDGGNDGLNTLVPVADNRYHDLRRTLAVAPEATLPIDSIYGMHPSLSFLHQKWGEGTLAFVRGVGYAPPNLSHFSSVDYWNAGQGAAASAMRSTPQSGWLGRWTDTRGGANLFQSATIGTQVPIMMRGVSTSSLLIPLVPAALLGATDADLNERWVSSALRSIAAAPTGNGVLGDKIARRTVRALDAAPGVATVWNNAITGTPIGRQLLMAANLINAGVGTRAVSVGFDGFDTHASQAVTHQNLLKDLDGALAGFFQRLDPAFANRVTLMTFSEFGRRGAANDSNGTDHGTSSVAMVLGQNVAGGLYGEDPGLVNLDSSGNPGVTVDFRRVYTTMLSGWLASDAVQVIGAAHETLPLFRAAPGVVAKAGAPMGLVTSSVVTSTITPPP